MTGRTLFRLLPLVALAAAVALCATSAPGCGAKTVAAGVDQAQAAYTQALGAVNDAHEAGLISDKAYVEEVTPARKAAHDAIERAKAARDAGDASGAKVFLDAANAAILRLQQLRGRPSSMAPAPAPVSRAGVDYLTLALALIAAAQRVSSQLLPIAAKLLKGEELTPEERDTADKAAAYETARADALEAAARERLAAGGGEGAGANQG